MAEQLSPLIFPSKVKKDQAELTRLLKEKKVCRIGPRLYSSLPSGNLSQIVRASWPQIISTLFPKSHLAFRSALEYAPTSQGKLFLIASSHRIVRYPGLTLVFIKGQPSLPDDPVFLNVRASSMHRAFLENLSVTKRSESRSIGILAIEQKLESILQIRGEDELNRIRDSASKVARSLKMRSEFKKLNSIIGGLLQTHASSFLSPEGQARAYGFPYSHSCLEKLHLLAAELITRPFSDLKEKYFSPPHFLNRAFFEAYFSNYIEGTQFDIEEAETIVFQKRIPQLRPEDGHDILSTFEILSDKKEMNFVPEKFVEFEKVLKLRHQRLMSSRPSVHPGEYKHKANRAGNSEFVSPDLVRGTLKKGFEIYKDLPKGLPRCIFLLFLITEVHPFMDGNGRVARIMMNAELVSQKLVPILIPNVFREDYLLALRAITRMHRPKPMIEMLIRAQKVSDINFHSYPEVLRKITRNNWFEEPESAKLVL